MLIAIPILDGKLCQHFGHCENFTIIEIGPATGKITDRKDLTPPPHEPGVLPKWLGDMGVNVIIAGGMGQRAQQLFDENKIEVIVGAAADEPENLVAAYLNKNLQTGENLCDH